MAALALAVRIIPLAMTGALRDGVEYDGAVMLVGALHLLAGESPYQDFVLVHPPGFMLAMTPAALWADAIGDSGAMALARVTIIGVGVTNTVLIGVLLRDRGRIAVLVGAGIYAVWPVVAFADRLVMLEPVLTLFLLTTLLFLQSSRRPTSRLARLAPWLAGVILGIALVVKYWAVIDVIIVGAMVLVRYGPRGLVRYTVAGAVTVGAVLLPFFLPAASQMWEQTVTAQLARTGTGTSVPARLNMMSPFWTTPEIDRYIPWAVSALVIAGIVALALMAPIRAVRRQIAPVDWDDATWWAALGVAHLTLILVSSSFYDHYAAWAIAPLALSAGAGAASLRVANRMRTAILAAAVIVVIAVPQFAPRPAVASLDELRESAADHGCVWATSAMLVAADAASASVAAGCPVDVDVFGVGMLGFSEAELDRRIAEQVAGSDAAIAAESETGWWWAPADAALRTNGFVQVGRFGGEILWRR